MKPELAAGDVVYFVYLHLETAKPVKDHAHKAGHSIVEVEGKARPMLIVANLAGTEGRQRWYRVAKITSKGKDESGKLKVGYSWIGDCIEEGKNSYVSNTSERYPANLMQLQEGRPKTVRVNNPAELSNFFKIISYKALGYGR